MPLIDKLVTDVAEGQRFHYAGRSYVLASDEESKRHPALGFGQVLAYHVPDRGDRVPVSFGNTIRVFVEKSS